MPAAIIAQRLNGVVSRCAAGGQVGASVEHHDEDGRFVGVHGAGCRWSGKTVEVWDKGGKRATKGIFVVDGGVKGYRGLRREVTAPCTCLACSTSGGWCGGGILDRKCVAIRRLIFTPKWCQTSTG